MSALSNLKLTNAKRPMAMPVVQIRRNKLLKKLHEQIQLAEAIDPKYHLLGTDLVFQPLVVPIWDRRKPNIRKTCRRILV